MVLVDSDVMFDIMDFSMMWIYRLHVEMNRWYESYLHVIFYQVKIDKPIEEILIEYLITL